jgi:enterochelin esterase-like enzyme
MQYAVYAPPDFVQGESLPLVVFLHGGGDRADCFDRAGIGQRLDAAIAAGRVPRAIIVVPEGELGFWENWYDGSKRYRDWVMRELVPHVRDEYGVRACPEGCHVVGISMGGHGALRFGFFEHASFASVTSMSGPVMSTQRILEMSENFMIGLFIPIERVWGPVDDRARIEREDLFLAWQTQADLHGVRLMLAWGTNDRSALVASNEAFDRHLAERGIEHRTLVFEGGHKWTAWGPALEEVLRIQIRE